MRIKSGEAAKPFHVEDIHGQSQSLQNYAGKKLLLAFFRHAACPLCNLRVHQLIQAYPTLQSNGVDILAFFESPKDKILQYVGTQNVPFPIVADPEREIYKLYGVESSIVGMMKGLLRISDFSEAATKKLMFFDPHNDIALIPADFLINPDLRIHTAYYGRDIGDRLNLSVIHAFAEREPESQAMRSLGIGD
jgi:thioredoxin-dependent peroxiredoxin